MQALTRCVSHRFPLLPPRSWGGLPSLFLLPLRQSLPPLQPPSHQRYIAKCSSSTKEEPTSQQLTDYDLDTFNYGDAWYWDKRYSRNSTLHEWYMNYSDIADFMRRFIPTSSRVLVVGCGNAAMSEDMVSDGYQEVVNIDVSPAVIDAMQKKYSGVPQLKYMTMDAQDLSYFGDCSFRSVVDKGCLDAMMCARNPDLCATKMLKEVSRILKPGGVFFLMVFGDPRLRLPELSKKEYSWTTSLYVIPEGELKEDSEGCTREFMEPVLVNSSNVPKDRDCYFVYICIKVKTPSLLQS